MLPLASVATEYPISEPAPPMSMAHAVDVTEPLTVRLNALVVADPPLHCTVKFAVAAVLGVPLSTPALLRVKPAGKLPALIDHVYGAVPPVAVNVPLYTTPTVAAGKGETVVIVSAAAACVVAETAALCAEVLPALS